MQYRQSGDGGRRCSAAKVIDIKEDPSLVERKKHVVKLEGLQLAAYRIRVEKVLRDLFESNDTLQRIKTASRSAIDLEALTALVLTQDPMLDLHDLVEYYPDCAGHLDLAIRGIIGLDAEAVIERFHRPSCNSIKLNSAQIRFLDLLQNHIAKYGSIEIARLYEAAVHHPPHRQHRRPVSRQTTRPMPSSDIIESFQPPKEGTSVA